MKSNQIYLYVVEGVLGVLDVLKKTNNDFKIEIYNLIGNEYIILSEYVSHKDDVEFKHIGCGYEFKMRPSVFLGGGRCPKCQKCILDKTTEYFKQEVYDLVKDEYTVLGEYVKAKHKIKIYHNYCKNIYETTPTSILSGHRCPICNESKGSNKIRLYLQNKDIYFNTEYKFPDLLSDLGNPLRFDFAVFKDKDKKNLIHLIEYDGIFHYKKQYDEQNFRLIQYHDELKNSYCKINNIPLLRIPYWELKNIENILIQKIIIKE